MRQRAVLLITADQRTEAEHDDKQHQQQIQQESEQSESEQDRVSTDGGREVSSSRGRTARSSVGAAVWVGPAPAVTACHDPGDSEAGSMVRVVRPAAPGLIRQELLLAVQQADVQVDWATLTMPAEQQQQHWLQLYQAGVEDLIGTELYVATYHIAFQPHLPEFSTSLGLLAEAVKISKDKQLLLYSCGGTFQQDCGAPFVTANGDVVGFHIAVVNALPSQVLLRPSLKKPGLPRCVWLFWHQHSSVQHCYILDGGSQLGFTAGFPPVLASGQHHQK